jgi:hypothetical protein
MFALAVPKRPRYKLGKAFPIRPANRIQIRMREVRLIAKSSDRETKCILSFGQFRAAGRRFDREAGEQTTQNGRSKWRSRKL